MLCNVCEVDREGEGVGRRGENSAEGPRLFSWKLRTDMALLSPPHVFIQLENLPVSRGEAVSLGERLM